MSYLKESSLVASLMSRVAEARGSSLARDERGLSTVEYVILLALIAAVAIGTWSDFGGKVHDAILGSSDEFDMVVKASEGSGS